VKFSINQYRDQAGFDSWEWKKIFLSSIASISPLGLIQPPIQWVLGTCSLGVKQPGHEAGHSLQSSAKVKNVWIYSSICPCLNGVVLGQTGTLYLYQSKMCNWITLMPKAWSDISDYLGDQSRFQAMIWGILNQGSKALQQLYEDRNRILH
jgi:hypothetical protein